MAALFVALSLSCSALAQATLDDDLLVVSKVFSGDEKYSVELRSIPGTNPIQFEVISVIETPSASPINASTYEGGLLTIPSIDIGDEDYWITLTTLSIDPPILQLQQQALNDLDDDNDGRADDFDAFPYDAEEFDDTDQDGIGDNADTDDDNDGVLDINDDLPLVAAYSEILPLEGNFSAGTFLEESVIDPIGTDTINEVGLGRFHFESDGSLLAEFPEGNQSGTWSIADGSLMTHLEDGIGLNFTALAIGVPDYLAKMFVLESVSGVGAFEVQQVLNRRDFQLVNTDSGLNTFWVVDHVEISILNDEVNLAWFGETNPSPIQVTFESSVRMRAQPDLPGESFTAEQLVGAKWALPLGFEAIGPNQLVIRGVGPYRESLVDDSFMLRDALVSFESESMGTNLTTGESFTWSIEDNGSLQIVLGDSDNVISVQILQALQFGSEVIASTTFDNASYYRKSLAMERDADVIIDTLFDEYLVRNFYLYSPENIGDDGRIKFDQRESVYIPFSAFNFAADGTAIRHRTVISDDGRTTNTIYPYIWGLDNLQATLERKDRASCDTTEGDCIRERRMWDVLKYENGRLYVLEEILYLNSTSSSFEVGQAANIDYYDVYEPTDQEHSILMENTLDLTAR